MSIADVLEGNDYSFPKEEKKILELWDRLDAFNEQLKRTEGKPEYIFYDGPPFATGLPHYGHILAGTLKVRSRPRPAREGGACPGRHGRPYPAQLRTSSPEARPPRICSGAASRGPAPLRQHPISSALGATALIRCVCTRLNSHTPHHTTPHIT